MCKLNEIPRFDTHSHSEYSNIRLLDSINKLSDMLSTAAKLGMAGLALTDHETVAGYVKYLKAEKDLKEKGIIPKNFKAALGNEIYLVEDRNNIDRYWHYILIAKNNDGVKALRELSSIAWYHSFTKRGMVRVPTEMRELEAIVKKYPNSLIADSACLGGFFPSLTTALIKEEKKKEQDKEKIYGLKSKIDEFLRWNINLFEDDFYIEIAAGTSKEQKAFNERVKSIAKAYNRKIVIGSDSHYLTAKERPLHKAYLNSKEGEREVDEFYYDAHMMDNEEAFENLMGIYNEEEFIEICNNSMEIFDKIEGYKLSHSPIIPEIQILKVDSINDDLTEYPTLKYLSNSYNIQERYWVGECLKGLKEKDIYNKEYLLRLETEADIIKTVSEKLNDCVFKYFNTFKHYIDLFWECGSIVGPGRGSAVCFLTNYVLGITQLDPIKWKLKEWRFLNKERVELPKL